MLTMYPACFYKDNDGYTAIFPDLDNLGTCGDSLKEVMEMAIDCLAGRINIMKSDGEIIPPASNIADVDIKKVAEDLDLKFEKEKSFVNIVSVDVDSYAKENFDKKIRKSVSIPVWLNDLAIENKVNLSQFLSDALFQKLVFTNTP